MAWQQGNNAVPSQKAAQAATRLMRPRIPNRRFCDCPPTVCRASTGMPDVASLRKCEGPIYEPAENRVCTPTHRSGRERTGTPFRVEMYMSVSGE